MRLLVLGSGAKDHAITWFFSQSKLINGLYVAHGNIGTEGIAVNLKYVNPSSPESVYRACLLHNIDTVFIGTEAPLMTGVVDFLKDKGIVVFGTPSHCLKLENDREYARDFSAKNNIQIPEHKIFKDFNTLSKFLDKNENKRFVIKSNEQAPSRVMIDSDNKQALLSFSKKLLDSAPILLEDHIEGLPLTVTLFIDNNGFLTLPICSEYTKTEEGGLPTGGMGAICPVPISQKNKEEIKEKIIKPVLKGMKEEDLLYRGVLTLSIILHKSLGPILVDYHVRLNDPATQAIIPLIKSDAVELYEALSNDSINDFKLSLSNDTCTAIVIASEGYPGNPIINKELAQISSPLLFNTFSKDLPLFFYGSVDKSGSKLITTGGRCITVVGRSNNIIKAGEEAYKAIKHIKFDGMWYRKDIGTKFYDICNF